MMDAEQVELLAVRSEFCLIVARWRLTQAEVASLLGVEHELAERVIPDVLGSSAETRLRLVVRLARGMSVLMPDDVEVGGWLRETTPVYDGASPLAAFSGLTELRAVVRAIEGTGWKDGAGELDGSS